MRRRGTGSQGYKGTGWLLGAAFHTGAIGQAPKAEPAETPAANPLKTSDYFAHCGEFTQHDIAAAQQHLLPK